MEEQIFNLYAIVEDDIVRSVGLTEHSISGTEEEKERFLERNAKSDFNNAAIYDVPHNYIITDFFGDEEDITGIPYSVYKKLYRGTDMEIGIFECALQDKTENMTPMVNISTVLDGKVIRENPFQKFYAKHIKKDPWSKLEKLPQH